VRDLVLAHARGEVVVTFGPGSALFASPKKAGTVVLAAARLAEVLRGNSYLTEVGQIALSELVGSLNALYPEPTGGKEVVK
jgi:hypothetical protein